MIIAAVGGPGIIDHGLFAANAPGLFTLVAEAGNTVARLIDVNDFRYGIIFCSTKIMVDELDEHLHSRGYACDRHAVAVNTIDRVLNWGGTR